MPACLTANVFADAKENTGHEITGHEIMEISGVFWRDITLHRQSL
jgi:hypothetical protein